MSIDFGVSTWLWTSPFQASTIALFPKIKSMGFSHVEIPIEDPAIIDGKEVAKALADHGLQAVACGAFGPSRDLTHDDPAVHQNCFDYIAQCFDLCATWSCSFLAGPMYSAVGKARLVAPQQREVEWKRAVANLHKVCEMAAPRDLAIAIEPLNRFETDLINTAEDLMRLIGDIDHPAAGVLLDGFHMNIEERSFEDAIRSVGDRLIHVQVSENYRGTPGSGESNWTGFKQGLRDIDYQGVISIESFTPNVQELAGAVCVWKPLVPDQDVLATDGLRFLKELFSE